eukprot:GEMP01029842.1.p1 GENE.GEMP01029842.1~~GEMP01029842.1.p1  ORF type:complete len:235 (+),score=46.45 GEMP01029842.1:132-836(+)
MSASCIPTWNYCLPFCHAVTLKQGLIIFCSVDIIWLAVWWIIPFVTAAFDLPVRGLGSEEENDDGESGAAHYVRAFRVVDEMVRVMAFFFAVSGLIGATRRKPQFVLAYMWFVVVLLSLFYASFISQVVTRISGGAIIVACMTFVGITLIDLWKIVVCLNFVRVVRLGGTGDERNCSAIGIEARADAMVPTSVAMPAATVGGTVASNEVLATSLCDGEANSCQSRNGDPMYAVL